MQNPTKYYILVVVCILALMISPAMHGQATGSFSGNVIDKSGSGIPGATVIATAQETGLARDDEDGWRRTLSAPFAPGRRSTPCTSMRPAFKALNPKICNLQIDEARELDFSLVPATVVTTVAVSGEAVAVESANPSLGQVITSQEVSQLPLEWPRFRSTGHAHRRRYGRDQPQQLFHLRRQQ